VLMMTYVVVDVPIVCTHTVDAISIILTMPTPCSPSQQPIIDR
jgi:hypothetical protein